MKVKSLTLLASSMLLGGCITDGLNLFPEKAPAAWENSKEASIDETGVEDLKLWWEKFNDPVLNDLIHLAFEDSPDRGIAEARILEARGIQRTSRSFLFPQVGASGNVGREDTGINGAHDFYDGGFDASFEIDVFGVNKKAASAAEAQVRALEAGYHNVSLTLVAEVARSYTAYRAGQKQVAIAKKNLQIQQKSLGLIQDLFDFGEVPRLDLERAKNLVNTTRASIPEFERQAENAKLGLVVLTGQMPDVLSPMLDNERDIMGGDVTPVLMAPAQVLAMRPDMRAAEQQLLAATKNAESVTATLFPRFNVGGFFGVVDNALLSSATIWNVALGTAVSLIDFGRIEGRINSARAQELNAYHQYRKTVLQAVAEVEMALNDYTKISERRVSLGQAYDNADNALDLSQVLFKEGESSYIDVLDAQRTLNAADSALVTAQAAQAQALIRIYKSLGVYK